MVTIEICVGSACHLKGSYHVVNRLQEIVKGRALEKKVEIKAAFCLGRCTESVSVRVNGEKIHSVSPDQVDEFFEKEILSLI
ncbi:(2Fe-2S) ferredoxin domain-containing protein [Oceanirhabdus sp. W0125-5]|uniref:(2Fe-2S) ferredoxin domain-containing protein n=1 Tax=Oceanirhabdus sp. W0125-5 TaxID=2999116 RepID=UPI0022F2C4F6|nr:NAD(P)H-dependent oxidoreductase subunit E [Oceanirhabdus sp. W0125-5]WBW98222.1 NAD(P)H-dependent oxidoreductase subunit E [Oceanirhabdus sp. W0125-5]